MSAADREPPTLDYASPRPPSRLPLRERIDLQFWVALTILLGLLLFDLSCMCVLQLRNFE